MKSNTYRASNTFPGTLGDGSAADDLEHRKAVVQWITDNTPPTPPGICAHCGGGLTERDDYSLLSGDGKGHVYMHVRCWKPWWADLEAQAERAARNGS